MITLGWHAWSIEWRKNRRKYQFNDGALTSDIGVKIYN